MAEVATKVRDTGPLHILKKRWRAWLRAVHRDAGYLAIGFTVIYAISGIAQNHIEDWGDVSYKATERTVAIPAIPADTPDDVAINTVAAVAGLGTPTAKVRAGDEVRLEYANGAKATAIGTQLTIQSRERRAFIGAANWLHTARNKKGWKYVADGFAVFLLYLAVSGIFMIKGKLGLKGRGAILMAVGVAVPIIAVVTSSPQPKAAGADPDRGKLSAPGAATAVDDMPRDVPGSAGSTAASAGTAAENVPGSGSATGAAEGTDNLPRSGSATGAAVGRGAAENVPRSGSGSAETIDTSGIHFLPPDEAD